MLCLCIHYPKVIYKKVSLHMSSADGMRVTCSMNRFMYDVVLCRILDCNTNQFRSQGRPLTLLSQLTAFPLPAQL